MVLAKNHRFYTSLLILTVITGSLFVVPFTVKATVPTIDFTLIGKAVLQLAQLVYQSGQAAFQSSQLASLNYKEYILDPAVKLLVSFMIQTLTRAIISWIQSGGNDNFISNLEAAATRAADEAAGEFLNKLAGINLCQPLAVNLRLAFRIPTLRDKLTCTATDILANLNTTYENFLNDFKNGGWIAFQTAMLPQNNYIDVLINSYDEKLRRESRQIAILENQYQAGQGFVGIRIKKQNCQDFPEYAEPICETQYVSTTPGTLVSDQLKEAFSAGWKQAVSADEIGEAIDAIIVALIQQLISSAQAGLTSDDEESGILDPEFTNPASAAPLPSPQPNLYISEGPSPVAASTILSGDTITFQGTIANNGGATTEVFNARFEIDINTDGTVDAILTPNPIINGLIDNGTEIVTSGPWTTVEGTHLVTLCADQPNPAVTESLENDNCSIGPAGSFTVGARPDLVISENPSLFSGTPVSGSQITFKGTVENQGGLTATSIFENRFQIDLGNNGTVDITLAPNPTIANLTPNSSQQILSPQWTAVSGTHRAILCADAPTSTIQESIETNNCNPEGTGVFTISSF